MIVMAAACGTDSGPGTGTADGRSPDGGMRGDAGAASEGCDQAAQHADLAWLQQHVFTPSCATALCHGGSDPAVGLSLAAGETHGNLVTHDASTASGWIRVVPGSPSQSYLMVALGRAPGPMPEDGFMPLGAPALCGPKLDAIARWITAGAPM